MLKAARSSGNVVPAAAGTSTSLKPSMAVCTTAGAHTDPRPASNNHAKGTAVMAATINAAAPTTGPEFTTMGTWATATSGMVGGWASGSARAVALLVVALRVFHALEARAVAGGAPPSAGEIVPVSMYGVTSGGAVTRTGCPARP